MAHPTIPKDVLRPYRERSASTAPRAPIGREVLAGTAKREDTRGIAAQVLRMSEDYQIQFGRLILEANLASVPVTVSAEDGDERAGKLAENLTNLWSRRLRSMADSITFGRVAYEKCEDFDRDNFLTTWDLDPLPYDKTEMMLCDGRFDGIEIKGSGDPVQLSAADSWWLALDPTSAEPHGRSRLKGAARNVFLDRREVRTQRAAFIKRFAMGWAKAHVQSEYKNEETGEIVDGHAKMQAAYEQMRSGCLVTFDNQRARSADGSEGEYLDDLEMLAAPTTSDPIDNTLDGMDVEQLRALGIPEKTVMEGESVGSFAMVSQQMKTLMAVVDGIVSQLAESFQKYVVDKLVALNWPEGERPTLTVTYPKLTEGPTALVYDLAKSILTGQPNPIVMSGGIDVPEIFRQCGIPTTPELAEIWADPKRRAKLMPAAPAPQPMAFGRLGLTQTGNGIFLQDGPMDSQASPSGDLSFFGDIPNRRQLVDDGLDRLADLYREMIDAAVAKSAEKVVAIREKIRDLQGRLAVAGRVLGLLSPWRPRLAAIPPGHGTQKPIKSLALNMEGYDWPWLETAVDFLKEKQLLTDDDFQLLDRDERGKALSTPSVDDRTVLQGLQSALVESLKAGEALPKFRERAEKVVALSRSETETLFRTQTKQAFLAGHETALANPVVAEEFPYVEFCATEDTRVRDSHWELDGVIVRRGSPEHQLFLRAFSDYNCRCSPRAVTEAEAMRRGISSMADLGSTARAEYQSP